MSDLVDGLLRLMASGESGPVNLGNPEEITVSDFARKIVQMVGSNSKIVHLDPVENDPRQRRPDISLAGRLLGWKPEVN